METFMKVYTWGHREGMGQMYAVVHAQSSGQNDVDAGDDVDRHVPEVQRPHHVHQGEHDAGHHHQAEVDVAEHHQRDQANGSQS